MSHEGSPKITRRWRPVRPSDKRFAGLLRKVRAGHGHYQRGPLFNMETECGIAMVRANRSNTRMLRAVALRAARNCQTGALPTWNCWDRQKSRARHGVD